MYSLITISKPFPYESIKHCLDYLKMQVMRLFLVNQTNKKKEYQVLKHVNHSVFIRHDDHKRLQDKHESELPKIPMPDKRKTNKQFASADNPIVRVTLSLRSIKYQ